MARVLYEFLVAPDHRSPNSHKALINFSCMANGEYEARTQAEAIYGEGCARSGIFPRSGQ